MTTTEFSNEFEYLLNTVHSGIVLNEYEKSIFLTKAQEELILSLYGSNTIGSPFNFDNTETIKRSLANLIKTAVVPITKENGLTPNSNIAYLPNDLWLITSEFVTLTDDNLKCSNKTALVVPITQDELAKIQQNPFRKSSENRVLRIDLSSTKVELISNYEIGVYSILYIKKPSPIILERLPSGLSINGESSITECELSPMVHREILNRAVTIAINAKIINNNNNNN